MPGNAPNVAESNRALRLAQDASVHELTMARTVKAGWKGKTK